MGQNIAFFAAGCFWKVENAFRQIEGVLATRVGFMGGTDPRPSYELVHAGGSGHVEVCEVVWDPARLGYPDLLEVFWGCHDPAGTGPAEGPGGHHRSVLFVQDDEQRAAAERSRAAARTAAVDEAGVRTEILPASPFWPAGLDHQQHLDRSPAAGR